MKIDWFSPKIKHVGLPAVISIVGIVFAIGLFVLRSNPPKRQRIRPAALVTVKVVQPRAEHAAFTGYGTVEPSKKLVVRPQVSGHVVKLNPKLEVGGTIESGQTLFEIDPRDYDVAVSAQKAAVARAKYELELEQGNQVVAKREFELLEDDIPVSSLGKTLALRKPQLEEKRAAYDAAKSQLAKAELDRARTEITTPFPALVLEESLEVGTYVSPQTTALTIASTDEFYVQVRVPQYTLEWLERDGKQLHDVRVLHRLGSGDTHEYVGTLVRVLGDVDRAGRMAQLLVSVKDPLKDDDTSFPLLLGTYVQVAFAGKQIPDLYELPRGALRENSQVWIVSDEGLLKIVDTAVVFSKESVVYVRGGLFPGAQVVTNTLPGALEGMRVEVVPPVTESVDSTTLKSNQAGDHELG